MCALAADRNTTYREGLDLQIPVYQSVKIYAGSMVCVNSSGYAVPAANASGNKFVGVAMGQADNSSGNSGDINVIVRTEGVFEFAATSIGQANLLSDMYVVDDQTFDETDPGHSVKCGKLLRYIGSTKGWLMIGKALASAFAGSADALTVSDGGDYFPAATNTVAEQIQALAAVPMVITIPRFTGWTKDGADKTPALPLLELPVPVRIKRAYLNLGTAPGADKTLVLDVNGTQAISIAGTDTQAEDESLDIAIAANTNIVVTANETASGAAANADLMLIAVLDDGE